MTRWGYIGAAMVMLAPAPAIAQNVGRNSTIINNALYDGHFLFGRIWYSSGLSAGGFGRGGGGLWWNHDYQTSDIHLPKILDAISTISARTDMSNVYATNDPALFKLPIYYLCEPGHWAPNESEVLGLRNYLLKGGFVIVDDFGGFDWDNFAYQMERVMPKGKLVPLPYTHAVWDSFFHITEADVTRMLPYSYRGQPQFFALFEDNDPKKRLMMVVNYNFDVSEFWEFSGTGYAPVDETNEAYKIGVNYVMYALSH